MAKGHLLITPTTKSKNEDVHEQRPSCCKQLSVTDAAILVSGIELAIICGYLFKLTTNYDANVYQDQKLRVNISLIVVPITIAVVMLTVFGIVGKRVWMLIPNIVAQTTMIAVFIAALVYLGGKVRNFEFNPETKNDQLAYQKASARLYDLKVYMALSIVALILVILSLIVVIMCFIKVFKDRNTAAAKKKEEMDNGY